jgi:FkbM family methyltransferase
MYREATEKRQAREGANWKFFPVALGNRRESSVLHLTRNQAASSLLEPLAGPEANVGGITSTGHQTVPVVTLDEFAAREDIPPPDLAKIDVQGFEAQVLSGGTHVLPSAKRLIIEVSLRPIYQDQQLLPSVLATLSSWGFELDDISEAYRQWPDVRQWQVDLWLTREQ